MKKATSVNFVATCTQILMYERNYRFPSQKYLHLNFRNYFCCSGCLFTLNVYLQDTILVFYRRKIFALGISVYVMPSVTSIHVYKIRPNFKQNLTTS
jgi:hypothetical protein